MKPESIGNLLSLLGEEADLYKRTGWVISRCPLGPWRHEDGQSSAGVFGVRQEAGDPLCVCFSCGFRGRTTELVFTMRMLNKKTPAVTVNWGEALQIIEKAENEEDELDLDFVGLEDMLFGGKGKTELTLYPDWWLESFPRWRDISWARAYLKERDVSPELADLYDLRADTKEKRVCFPVRDFKGRLVGLHGRAIDSSTDPRYRMYTYQKKNNPLIWLGEDTVDLTQPMVVVEGPFDAIAVRRVCANVVTPLFASPSKEKLLRMADCYEWVTLLDRGTGGDVGRQRINKYLGSDYVIRHLKVPEGRKDPGECTTEELREILAPYVKVIQD